MTTHLEAEGTTRVFNVPKIYLQEVIRGGDPGRDPNRDIVRSFMLYDSSGYQHPEGRIRCEVYNTQDRALCYLQYEIPPENTQIHVTFDEVEQTVDATPGARNRWEVGQDQELLVWFGGSSFDERDPELGYVKVTWTDPQTGEI